jgi:hypothetical protein
LSDNMLSNNILSDNILSKAYLPDKYMCHDPLKKIVLATEASS